MPRKSGQPGDIDAPATIMRGDIFAAFASWKAVKGRSTSEEHRRIKWKQPRRRGRPPKPNLAQTREGIAKAYADSLEEEMSRGLTPMKAKKAAREKVMDTYDIERSTLYTAMKESKKI